MVTVSLKIIEVLVEGTSERLWYNFWLEPGPPPTVDKVVYRLSRQGGVSIEQTGWYGY